MSGKQAFELTTTIGRLGDIDVEQLRPYDSVYIGDPFCELGINNLLTDKDALLEGIKILKDSSKKIYLSTYVDPRIGTFAGLEHLIEIALKAGVDAVEVSNLGVLRLIYNHFPGVDIYASNYIRLFNVSSVKALSTFNVKRIVPYPELSLAEIEEMKENSSVDIELQVHGKIPLGHTELCILIPQQTKIKNKCAGLCYEGFILRSGETAMKAAGRVGFGHKDLCMLNYMGVLLERGFRHFRIESRFENGQYRFNVGQIYRLHIESLLANREKLLQINVEGVCNGFYFERPGMEYVQNI